MVKLRLKRMGAIDKPFYRIVVVDSRKKRDGIYLESLGYYDPKTDPFTLKVDIDKCINWLKVGAQPSDTVRSLLKRAGVIEKWHNIRMGLEEKVKVETVEDKPETEAGKETELKAEQTEPVKEEKKAPAKKAKKTAAKKDEVVVEPAEVEVEAVEPVAEVEVETEEPVADVTEEKPETDPETDKQAE